MKQFIVRGVLDIAECLVFLALRHKMLVRSQTPRFPEMPHSGIWGSPDRKPRKKLIRHIGELTPHLLSTEGTKTF